MLKNYHFFTFRVGVVSGSESQAVLREVQINVNGVITDNVLYGEHHLLLDSLVVDAVRHLHVYLVNPLQHHFKLWGECFKDALELDIILCLHSQSIPD